MLSTRGQRAAAGLARLYGPWSPIVAGEVRDRALHLRAPLLDQAPLVRLDPREKAETPRGRVSVSNRHDREGIAELEATENSWSDGQDLTQGCKLEACSAKPGSTSSTSTTSPGWQLVNQTGRFRSAPSRTGTTRQWKASTLVLTRFGGHLIPWDGWSREGVHRAEYPYKFRLQVVDLVRAGRTPEELAREFEPAVQTFRNWVH